MYDIYTISEVICFHVYVDVSFVCVDMQAPIASLPSRGESKLHQVYRKCARMCVCVCVCVCVCSYAPFPLYMCCDELSIQFLFIPLPLHGGSLPVALPQLTILLHSTLITPQTTLNHHPLTTDLPPLTHSLQAIMRST